MGILLIPVIVLAVLVVMAATTRSLGAGLAVGLLVVAALALTGGEDRLAAAGAGAVAGAGVVLGYAARGRLGRGRALVLAALPLTAAFAASAFTSERPALEQELARWVEREAGRSLEPALEAEMAEWLLGLVPASAALISFLLVLATYWVAIRVLPRFGLEVRRPERFASLALPFAVVWSFALTLLLCAAGRAAGVRWVLVLGVNLALVHGAAFFAQGLAVGREVLTQRTVPAGMQIMFAVLAVVMLPLTIAVVVVGLLDQWFDFRRLLAPPREGSDDGGS
jgi:hypothetical protein